MPHPSVLVDTCIFIEFFRSKKTDLETLIRENRVLLSSVVRLELLQGVRKSEASALETALGGLGGLPLWQEHFDQAEKILSAIKGRGLTIGLPDLLLAAQAGKTNIPIYSKDKVFQELSELKQVRLFQEGLSQKIF